MKNKKKLRNIIVVISVLVAVVLFMAVSCFYPYTYMENCFYSNRDDFEKIQSYLESLYDEDKKHIIIETGESSNYDEITAILVKLQKQYQSDSKYPVFSYVDVYYDNDGDMMFYIQIKKEKLKNSDGVNSPDIRLYQLVYIDENYDGRSPAYYRKPFCDNWYTWSADRHSC